MPQSGAAGSAPGIENTIVEAYQFTVVSTTSTTVISAGADTDTPLNVTVASSALFVVGQDVTADINTASAEVCKVTAVPDGTHVTILPLNSTGFRYAHASGWTLQFSVLAPASVVRDASTYANTLGVDASHRALVYASSAPVGVGGDFVVSAFGQPATNGITLATSQAQVAGSIGCQFIIPPGGSIGFTVALAAPVSAPSSRTYGNPSSATSPLVVNVDLAGTAMVYVTALTGTVLARWI